MISLLDLDKITSKLIPVTTHEYTSGRGEALHPEGLFSETIFGLKDSIERKRTYSFIELGCKILHPALYKIIKKLNRKIISAIEKEETYNLDDNGVLERAEDGEINGVVAIVENFSKISLSGNDNRLREDLIKMVQAYHKKDMVFVSKLLVIPPYYREIEKDEIHGGFRADPLNEFYVKIIRLSLQIQSISFGSAFDVMSTKMQYLVNELYSYISQRLSKKEGLVRSSILGKRVDFTGRGVIAGASSEVDVDEIGVPFRILIKVFEPFVIYQLMNSGNVDRKKLASALKDYNQNTLSVPSLRNLIIGIYNGDELTPELEALIKIGVELAIKDKVVLAKRDPALHAESVQAFKPRMIDGYTIKLNILKCSGFNADFDGDSCCCFIKLFHGNDKTEWVGHISELEDLKV